MTKRNKLDVLSTWAFKKRNQIVFNWLVWILWSFKLHSSTLSSCVPCRLLDSIPWISVRVFVFSRMTVNWFRPWFFFISTDELCSGVPSSQKRPQDKWSARSIGPCAVEMATLAVVSRSYRCNESVVKRENFLSIHKRSCNWVDGFWWNSHATDIAISFWWVNRFSYPRSLISSPNWQFNGQMFRKPPFWRARAVSPANIFHAFSHQSNLIVDHCNSSTTCDDTKIVLFLFCRLCLNSKFLLLSFNRGSKEWANWNFVITFFFYTPSLAQKGSEN